MRIALIRHLPTNWNKNGYLQGKRDIPVSFPFSDQLKAEIEKNCRQLAKWAPFDAVFASSLMRTQQTANAYGYDSFMIERDLDELNFGRYEGKPKMKLLQDYGNQWIEQPLVLEFEESLVDFQQRIFSFLHRYNHLDKILVFGHGSWIRGLMSIATSGDINQMNTIVLRNNELIMLSILERLIRTKKQSVSN